LANLNINKDLYSAENQEKIFEKYLLTKDVINGKFYGLGYGSGKHSLKSQVDGIANQWRSMPQYGGKYVEQEGGSNPQGSDPQRLDLHVFEYLQAMMQNRPGFKKGGFVKGNINKTIPANLHGGEYVLNANAVKKIGIPALNAINANKPKPPIVPPSKEVQDYREQLGKGYQRGLPRPSIPMRPQLPRPGGPGGEMYNSIIPAPLMPSNNYRFAPPGSRMGSFQAPVTNNVSTVNIQVENFVGQEEWFNSMMKEYNINVLPKNQKLAGLESRKFTSYNGINQGM